MMNKVIWKILAISIVLMIAGSGIVVGAGPVNNVSNCFFDDAVSYPINLDAIEEVYPLDPSAKEKLFKNGFVVLKDYEHENISDRYMDLFWRHNVSVFVTSDALLHVFHVVHDDMLKDIEKQYLYNSTELLVQDMQKKSMDEYENTSSTLTHVKEAARRNVVFFTVACKLLNDTYPVPSYAEENVTEYVQKILNHSVVEFYPGDDYTQYEPRGHYEGDPALEKYFRCMKWLSRHIFRIEDKYYPEDSHIEMIQAVMISEALQESPGDTQLWEKEYNITKLLVGTADSITPLMVQKAVSSVFGENFTISMLEDVTNIEKLREEFKKPEYPKSQIIPVPLLYPDQIPPKYVQFMGERFILDGYVFQQVTYPYIPDLTRLPKGLDVMATMLGSKRADQLLEEEKQTYPGLESQMEKLKEEFENYTADDWKKNVYCNWFYTLEPLLTEFNQSYPLFMQNTAWQDEKLNTALSSWTQLRHDYILYAKPTYIPLPIPEGYGYVEPIPEFYNRLASLCRKIDTELSNESVLQQKYHDHLILLAERLDTFETYAQEIVNNQTLTTEDQYFPPYGGEQDDIHGFGLWLVEFFDSCGYYPPEEDTIGEEEPTLVVDVCTNCNTGKVLHEGVGRFNPLIIVYEQPDGITLAGIGYVMSYYEFEEENFTRITDSEWMEWVENGTLSPRPFWANSFLYPVENATMIYVPDDYAKIQWAVDNASAGDTIFVYKGTYPEHINISKNNLTIIGENKDSTIIDGGWSRDAIVNVNADLINISGFTIKSHKKDIWDSHIGILLSYSNNNEITNNSCLNNSICLEESSNNNIIANNTALFDFVGIGLWSSNNNVIANNNVSFHGDYGIILESSSCNNTVISNFAANSCWGIGLRHSSNYNRITNNNLSNNGYGISFYLSSNDNIIANNNILDNGEGIWLGESSNNNIAFNNILDNHYGISLRDSSNNNIYLNDVINNSNNVCSEASANIWNSTSKITYTCNGKTYTNYLGNYWSDYKEKYPDAEEIDKCGIWDTPYSIDSDADNYPLVEPFENYFAPPGNIFDTGAPANPYPSIFGTHKGTIIPNVTIEVSKLYTYPCPGTGGHSEYVKIWNETWDGIEASWGGYMGDYHNITFPESFSLRAEETYNYTIRTSSYPQIHHTENLTTQAGFITCTEFLDANGKKYHDWIPAIRLFR